MTFQNKSRSDIHILFFNLSLLNTTTENLTHLDKMRDNASSMVNHKESTIEMQRTAVSPMHFGKGSSSHLGDSS